MNIKVKILMNLLNVTVNINFFRNCLIYKITSYISQKQISYITIYIRKIFHTTYWLQWSPSIMIGPEGLGSISRGSLTLVSCELVSSSTDKGRGVDTWQSGTDRLILTWLKAIELG